MNNKALFLLGIFFVSILGCQSATDEQAAPNGEPEEQRPVVIAINYPLANATHQLASEWIELQCPVPQNEDPAFWFPKDAQITAMQNADLVLLNAAGHEPWRQQVMLSPLNLTFTARGFRDQWISQKEVTTHQHGPKGEHTHSGFAYTTWLDPVLFREQVYVVGQSLSKLLPSHQSEITSRTEKLQAELKQLDQSWQSATKKLGEQPLLASHPVYQYLAARYNWNLQALHWEPSQVLTEKEWAEFAILQKNSKARFMLWEAEPTATTQDELTSRGIKIIVIKPLANGTLEENIIKKMQANQQNFADAIQNN